ncbi:hypothetical protein [Caballeronia choica]|nr:hypothetical protein [Caballeronia choica]
MLCRFAQPNAQPRVEVVEDHAFDFERTILAISQLERNGRDIDMPRERF